MHRNRPRPGMLAMLVGMAALLSSSPIFAETWTGSCNQVMFRFDRLNDKKVFYLFLITSPGSYPVAQGDIVAEFEQALRANIQGSRKGFQGLPVYEIGLNQSTKEVYTLYRDEKTGQVTTRVFAKADVTIRDNGDTWIGKCPKIQFTFSRPDKRFLLHFQTDAGLFEVARGKIGFDNNISVSAAITGAPVDLKGRPLAEIVINKANKAIYIDLRDPTTGKIKTGLFGNTDVTISK